MTTPNPFHAAALAYAAKGIKVFPLRPRSKEPLPGTHGHLDATTNQQQIEAWWAANPESNIGIVMGGPVWCLDIDGPEGHASLAALEDKHGKLPFTATSITGGGGMHLLYSKEPGQRVISNNTGKLGSRIDIKGDGGYLVAPPSIHPNGNVYAWEEGQSVFEFIIEDPPAWLMSLVLKAAKSEAAPTWHARDKGDRNTETLLILAQCHLDRAVVAARANSRNGAAFDMACQLRDDGLTEGEALTLVRELYRLLIGDQVAASHPRKLDMLREPARIVRNAYKQPAREISRKHQTLLGANAMIEDLAPATVARPCPIDHAPAPTDAPATETPALAKPGGMALPPAGSDDGFDALINGACGDAPIEAAPLDLERSESELGVALAFRKIGQGRHLWILGESWRSWDGHKWADDSDGILAARTITHEVPGVLFTAAAGCMKVEGRDRLAKTARLCSKNGPVKNAMALARSLEGMSAHASEFDANPDLLPCANGVLDLRDGKVYPHKPETRNTFCLSVAYDPDAKAPRWEKFLSEILLTPGGETDVDLVNYMQRCVGYFLTPSVKEQCFWIWFGSTGSNGKSVLADTLAALLGPLRQKVPSDLLCQTKQSQSGGTTPELAKLRGARLALCDETTMGARFNEEWIKSVTGGEELSANPKYRDPIIFMPQFKLVLRTNHKPKATTSSSFWRRVRLVNFRADYRYSPNKDPDLGEKLKHELPGILAWAVRGCLEWRKTGLAEPEAVNRETRVYLLDNDTVSNWIAACCSIDPAEETTLTRLYLAFEAWSSENGERPLGRRAFKSRLIELGQGIKERMDTHGCVIIRGLALQCETKAKPNTQTEPVSEFQDPFFGNCPREKILKKTSQKDPLETAKPVKGDFGQEFAEMIPEQQEHIRKVAELILGIAEKNPGGSVALIRIGKHLSAVTEPDLLDAVKLLGGDHVRRGGIDYIDGLTLRPGW